MRILREVALRIRALFSRKTAERDLNDELHFHLEMAEEEGVRRGLSADQARRQARLRFGGVERFREETRRMRRFVLLDDLARNARIALRTLRRSPIFTIAAVGTVALGIGANTAIFSVVNAVLLGPSPFPDPDRLLMVWETDRASETTHEPASWPDVVDFARESRTLESIGSFMGVTAMVESPDGPRRLTGLAVTVGLLETLGVAPVAGRAFRDDDASTGPTAVAMLGEGYWREAFGADPTAVGGTLTINNEPFEIVGVLPREADLGIREIHARADYSAEFVGGDVAVWLALRPGPDEYPRATHPFLTLARLAPGADLDAAQQELARIAAELEATYPENENRGVNLESYADVVFGPVRAALVVLLGAVFVVLLIACANVANLLLTRAVNRSREVSVRRALGASAGQLGRQFAVEAALLAGLGTVVGVVVGLASLEGLLAIAPPDIPRLQETTLDARVFGFVALAGVGVAFVFGMIPAWRVRATHLSEALTERPGRRTTEGRRARGIRSTLMVAQVALAVTLVIGAGVLFRSFQELRAVDPGFDAAGVVTVAYQLPPERYETETRMRWPDHPATNGFHAALLERVQSLPGVLEAAVSEAHPLDPGYTNSFTIVGREDEARDFPEIRIRFVSPGYLETLGVPLFAGRDVAEGDVATAPPVAMINRAAAERYFGTADPVGQELSWWGITRRIIGVIGDERFLGVDVPSGPAAYVPLAQGARGRATLLVRASSDPLALVPGIRAELRSLDPEVPLFDEGLLASALWETLRGARFITVLLSLFAGLALVLALIGVQGVLSYSVAQRAPEVGIRMALGAERGGVVRGIVGEGLKLAGIGVLIGIAGALAASRLLGSLVFGVPPVDPLTYGVVVVSVLVAAGLASLFPALRASGASPSAALRAE